MVSFPSLLLCVKLVSASSSLGDTTSTTLRSALQITLDGISAAYPEFAVQLGWKSEAAEFTLASGQHFPPGSSGYRPITTEDTFLWGSITKPYTAAAVMSLVERGVVSLDDSLESHINPVIAHFEAGASLQGMFGPNASKITVGHTLRMESGVQDFDFAPFDNFLLATNETYRVHSPYEFVKYASEQPQKLLFEPGTHVSYSSNNFILAGFILLAHAGVAEWWELDLRSFFSESARASLGGSQFYQREILDKHLTVPGHTGGGWAKLPNTTIWNQSSSILGWTCGNMVATAGDVASFIFDLLGPRSSVLQPSTIKTMTKFKPLDFGWSEGRIQYGVGLMIESSSFTTRLPPEMDEWGVYMGHGGDTFGFLSEVGIVYGLNASVAIVVNQDHDGLFVTFNAMCKTIQTAARVLLDKHLDLNCTDYYRAGPMEFVV